MCILRKYKLVKTEYETEQYVRMIMSKSHRYAFAKLRSGVAPLDLRIETGRYEGLRVNERICPFSVKIAPKTNFMFYFDAHSIMIFVNFFL